MRKKTGYHLTVRRGAVLVSVLFLVLVLGMLMRALIVTGPLMSRLSLQSQDELLATRVAEMGLIYAQTQLREKSDWKGDLNTTTVNLPDFKVLEDKGNVFGWSKDASGVVSVFRIRFNYQDGAGGPDGLDDPTNKINSTYVSMNNLGSSADVVLPRADGSTFAVTDIANGPFKVPGKCMALEVEGVSGPAVAGLNGPTDAWNGAPSGRKILRVILAASLAPSAVDASLSAAAGIDFETQTAATVKASAGAGDPQIRSKKQFSVKNVDGTTQGLNMTGKVSRDPLLGMTANVVGTVTQSDETQGDGKDFYNLKWDDVPKASTDDTKAVQIQGGVYILNGTQMIYYDKTLTDYKALTPDSTTGLRPGGVVLSADFKEVRPSSNLGVGGVSFDNSTYTLSFTRDVNVNASPGGVSDIVISPLQGRRLQKDDTAAPYRLMPSDTQYAFGQVKMQNTTFSAKGNVACLLNLIGENASVTTEGDAVLAAPSIALKKTGVATMEQRLSVYAKKDLTLSTFMSNPEINAAPYFYLPAFEGYGPLQMQGLAYSWANTNIYAATPGQTSPSYMFDYDKVFGKVDIQGAVVSYGGDPLGGVPGSDGSGVIKMFAREANIEFDPSKLVASSASTTPGGPLQACKRVSYGFER